jgi:hypothetical protein
MSVQPNFVVDWEALLEQLRDLEVRTGTISEATGIAVSTIREYRLGMKTPLHAKGEAIIRFWCSTTGRDRKDLPMTQAMPSTHAGR